MAAGGLLPPGPCPPKTPRTLSEDCSLSENINYLKLSTTDLLVPASMKNAAKCDT